MEWCSLVLPASLSISTMTYLTKALIDCMAEERQVKRNAETGLFSRLRLLHCHWPLMAISCYYKDLHTKDEEGKKMTPKIFTCLQTPGWTEATQNNCFRQTHSHVCMCVCVWSHLHLSAWQPDSSHSDVMGRAGAEGRTIGDKENNVQRSVKKLNHPGRHIQEVWKDKKNKKRARHIKVEDMCIF